VGAHRGLSGSRVADVGERWGVRVPWWPRSGVDGAFEGYVRPLFTVAAPLAREAAIRLASVARQVRTGGVADTPASSGYIV
jgi:hypothetical protein